MERKVTSIKMDPDIWMSVRMHCIKKGISASLYIENLVRKDLKLQ